MSESPHLGLGYLAPSQAQKHVTVNEAFRRLDALVQLGVKDHDRTAAPSSPDEGDRHIVAPGATGDWAGQDGRIAAFLDGRWVFVQPKPGWLAYDAATEELLAFVDGAWIGAAIAIASLDGLEKLGVGASADLVNRLVVASQAALFTHRGAGVQLKLNKAASGDTASFLFQTAYSGRAECGLAGSDGFSLKVSADGSAWTTALTADPATGAVDLPHTPGVQVDKFVASGTWTKPAWARRVRVVLISGGSGGGSGGLRGASVAVSGGGGGGPGGFCELEFSAADLPATVAVTVGAGGAGGVAQTTAGADGLPGDLGGISSFDVYVRARPATTAAGGGTASSGAAGVTRGYSLYPPSIDVSGGAGATAAGAAGGTGPGRVAGGGGGGGGVSAANVASAGALSGASAWLLASTQRANGGVADGGAGAAGALFPRSEHLASSSSGGGGGGARNGFASGRGGAGARGEVWVISSW